MIHLTKAQRAAVAAARAAGALLRRNLHAPKRANHVFAHDIKLELDVRSQALIQRRLGRAFPEVAFLGEEGQGADVRTEYRWVVDPIDGTVNYAYGIPHACISIALQGRARAGAKSAYDDGYQTLVGVVYDPFCDELWSATRGGPARLNGRIVRVSRRAALAEAIVTLGSPNSSAPPEMSMPRFAELVRRVRKIRVMGSAALSLTYLASGRFDGYIEGDVKLWDIAAGGLLVECAGGTFARRRAGPDKPFAVVASNGRLHEVLRRIARGTGGRQR